MLGYVWAAIGWVTSYNKGLPFAISSLLYLLKEKYMVFGVMLPTIAITSYDGARWCGVYLNNLHEGATRKL